MKMQISKTDLENPAVRSTFVKFVDALKHGGFMHVQGFSPKYGHGEVQNGTFQKGIDYGNALAKSLEQLNTIEADAEFTMTVTHGAWINADGEANPTARKSKAYPTYTKTSRTVNAGDTELTEAIAKLRKDIARSQAGDTRPTVNYTKLGNGVYEHPETGSLYFRDLRRISKTVVTEGEYPNKASKPTTAIADALRRKLSIGQYRMFNCDGDWDTITIDGVTIENEILDTISETESAPAEESTVPETVN